MNVVNYYYTFTCLLIAFQNVLFSAVLYLYSLCQALYFCILVKGLKDLTDLTYVQSQHPYWAYD